MGQEIVIITAIVAATLAWIAVLYALVSWATKKENPYAMLVPLGWAILLGTVGTRIVMRTL